MIKVLKKKFKPRIKARLRKNRIVLAKNIDNFDPLHISDKLILVLYDLGTQIFLKHLIPF